MGLGVLKATPVSIGSIIKILHDPFYTGEFEYPKGSGTWYKGSYEPIISKEIFKATQAAIAKLCM